MSNGKHFSSGQLSVDHNKLQQSGLRSTITFNTSGPITDSFRLNGCNSTKHLNTRQDQQLLFLQQENKMLRTQINQLKIQLKREKMNKNDKLKECDQEIDKLKKLVEKGYYSIRSLQTQKTNLSKQSSKVRTNCQFLMNKCKCLQDAKQKLQITVQKNNIKHQEQIKLVWERVAHLQNNLQSIVKIIQQDKQQWKKWKNSSLNGSRAFNRKN